jgi:nucleotide-binding universal stress UspA family protein
MISTDLGKISNTVIKKGIELAVKLKAPIHLIHVMSGDKATPHATPNAYDSIAKDRIQMHNKLERAQEWLRDSGCPFTIATPAGEVITELKAEVQKIQPYILVLGALHNNALHHVVSGSVAGTILESTKCQVLLVPENKDS